MPIGLPDVAPRTCDSLARRFLGPRRSSVFSPPYRQMLAFDDYADANAWGKANVDRGLSRQSWGLAAKIRDVDGSMTPALQTRVIEAHPEVAFARLGGAPCAHAKKSAAGEDERMAIVDAAGLAEAGALVARIRETHGKSAIGADDVLDACATALAAKARLEGAGVRFSDEQRDARGLVMEIWG